MNSELLAFCFFLAMSLLSTNVGILTVTDRSSPPQSVLSLQEVWGLTPPLVEKNPVVENIRPWFFSAQNPSGDKTFWASAMKCYECNVWKAGYGNLCDQPRIRDNCFGCMKTETTIFMGYYKNTPRYSTIISRICANSRTIAFSHECQYYETVDGHSRRCYCNTDLCNGALPSAYAPVPMIVIFSSLSVALLILFR